MRKRHLWAILLLLLVGMVALACQRPAPTPTPTPAPVEAVETPAMETPTPVEARPEPQEVIRWTCQSSFPTGSSLYTNFTEFAEKVKRMSNGRLEIETLPAGAVVAAFEVLDAVNDRVLDCGHSAPGYYVGKHRAAIPLSHGPLFGMDFIDMWGWYYHGGGLELLNEWYQDVLGMNVLSFPILPAGPQALGWFPREIEGWEDFKGLKFRIYGLGAEVFKRAGMSVVTLPGAEILPALERGVIDGAEWVTPYEDIKMGFYDILKYYYMPGMHEPVTFGDLIINRDAWEALPDDLKEIVRVATRDTFIQWWTWFIYQNAKTLEELQTRYGVQVRQTPRDILETFLKFVDEVYAEDAERDPFFAKVLESQKAYAGVVVPARVFMFPEYRFRAEWYWKEKLQR